MTRRLFPALALAAIILTGCGAAKATSIAAAVAALPAETYTQVQYCALAVKEITAWNLQQTDPEAMFDPFQAEACAGLDAQAQALVSSILESNAS